MGVAKKIMTEQILGITKNTVKCPHCNKTYIQEVEEQIPGFREMDYDICPYCNAENGRSMSEEYYNSKVED